MTEDHVRGRPRGRIARRMGSQNIVFAGGGTAGHVLPALAVADALVGLGHEPDRIVFIGSRRGQERHLIPDAGYEIELLPGRGVVRSLSRTHLLANVSAVTGLGVALARSITLLRNLRPSVLVAVGGYASLPPALAAAILRIPIVVLNVDAVPGGANRVASRLARLSAVAWPGTGLPRARVTGTPLRGAITSVDSSPQGRESAKVAMGVDPRRKLVVVVGGSLGAARLNAAAVDLARHWSARSDLAIHHIVGRRDWRSLSRPVLPDKGVSYRAVEYEDDMARVLTAADVVVSRSGAGTVAELAAVGRASVLVPLPNAPGDHQSVNARILADVGAAEILADRDCDGARLASKLDEMVGEVGRLEVMERAAAKLATLDAAEAVARLVGEAARPDRSVQPVRGRGAMAALGRLSGDRGRKRGGGAK